MLQVTEKPTTPAPTRPSRVEQMIALLRQHQAEIERPERGSVTIDFAGGKVAIELKAKLGTS